MAKLSKNKLLLALLSVSFLTACQPGSAQSVEFDVASPLESIEFKNDLADFMGVTGNVVKLENFSSKFVIPRHIEIWLPPSYNSNEIKHYPVIYMHDGQNIFDPSQSQYSGVDWGVDETMTHLIQKGDVREAIIVGAWSTNLRNAEYFPEKAADEFSNRFSVEFPEFEAKDIQSDRYLKFLVEELKPYIDENYRTLPDRDNTSLMGSSMGGLISIYAITEYPDVFGGAGCVSTHFPLGDGAIIEYLANKLPDPSTHKIYFDYGTETLDHNYEAYQNRMDSHMISSGYDRGENWMTVKYDGHDHSERAWRARVHIPLKFLLGENDET